MVAVNEQVQNIEKSKASFVQFVSRYATVKARFNTDNQMYISNKVKSTLSKLRD